VDQSTYNDNAATGGARIGVFQRSHARACGARARARARRTHDQKTLVEIYLLSFSDVLLTSGISTFGYVSSSLA
jgi:xyloglucan fucosyltransferase